MSTTYSTTWLERTSASKRYASSLIWRYWDAFQERRDRRKLRSALSDLSDRELMDIGTTRGEIDYVVSNRGIDPRNIQSRRQAVPACSKSAPQAEIDVAGPGQVGLSRQVGCSTPTNTADGDRRRNGRPSRKPRRQAPTGRSEVLRRLGSLCRTYAPHRT